MNMRFICAGIAESLVATCCGILFTRKQFWLNSLYYFIVFNLLQTTGYVMHQQVLTFNNCTLCPHCIYLRTNSDLCHLHHKL